jgi:hypothetical protein
MGIILMPIRIRPNLYRMMTSVDFLKGKLPKSHRFLCQKRTDPVSDAAMESDKHALTDPAI